MANHLNIFKKLHPKCIAASKTSGNTLFLLFSCPWDFKRWKLILFLGRHLHKSRTISSCEVQLFAALRKNHWTFQQLEWIDLKWSFIAFVTNKETIFPKMKSPNVFFFSTKLIFLKTVFKKWLFLYCSARNASSLC